MVSNDGRNCFTVEFGISCLFLCFLGFACSLIIEYFLGA